MLLFAVFRSCLVIEIPIFAMRQSSRNSTSSNNDCAGYRSCEVRISGEIFGCRHVF